MRTTRCPPSAEISHRQGGPRPPQPRPLAAIPERRDLGVLRRPFAADGGGRLGERPAQLGAVGGAVVALAVVLPDQLPVAPLDDRLLVRDLGLPQPVRGEVGLDPGAEGLEVGRLVGEADEDEPADAAGVEAPEAVRARIEPLAHVAAPNEATVEAVAPLMVRADEPRRPALGGRADAGT